MGQSRSDTRERIQEIALKFFTEKGYDKTSLREIAEQLGVTKAALYYHFKSKEEILLGIMGDLRATMKELTDWAATLQPSLESRIEIVKRLANLIDTRWRPMIRFAQANQTHLHSFRGDKSEADQIGRIFSLVRSPSADSVEAYKCALGVLGLLFAAAAPPQIADQIGGDLSGIALEVAIELISQGPSPA